MESKMQLDLKQQVPQFLKEQENALQYPKVYLDKAKLALQMQNKQYCKSVSYDWMYQNKRRNQFHKKRLQYVE